MNFGNILDRNRTIEYRYFDSSLDPARLQANIKLACWVTKRAAELPDSAIPQERNPLGSHPSPRDPDGGDRLLRRFADLIFRAAKGQVEAVLGLPTLRLAADARASRGLMYRLIYPGMRQELPLRMLFHPVGEGTYLRACEADTFRGLVAALLDHPDYERSNPETRLQLRLRLADDVKLLGGLAGLTYEVADRDGPATINTASDEPFLRSLHQLGVISLEPSLADPGKEVSE